MKQKGFTLIELLAVIVILAIIAIIAVPVILNVIEKSKESSAVDSAYGYINAIETNLATAEVKSGLVAENKEYVDLREFEETYNVTVKGTKPESGRFTLEKRKVVSASFVINDYSIVCSKKKCESRGKNVELVVTYNANGGTLSKTEERVLKNSTLNLPTPTKNDYVFVGWYTEENGGEEVTNETPITSSQTLYAQFVKTVTEFNYTGNEQEYYVYAGRRYKLEVWGAQGSAGDNGGGAQGGYSYGEINAPKTETYYVYVGGQAGTANTSCGIGQGGWNGGAQSGSENGEYTGAGGGASDIRCGNKSLYSRVIVAGGGGGADQDGSVGGYGAGGLNNAGAEANGQYSSSSDAYSATPYRAPTARDHSNETVSTLGTFGQGGYSYINCSGEACGGGGGGWYGGNCHGDWGTGGSGWLYTEAAYNTWKNTTPNDANNYQLDSSYYLTNSGGTNGNRSGNGFVRITYLGK